MPTTTDETQRLASDRLPCYGHEALYDTALDNLAAAPKRQQAIHQAATLCATCPAPCDQKVTPSLLEQACCPAPSYGTYLAHKRRGEDACEASKAMKREYDRERYAKNPRRARAPQRAYEARLRAARQGRVT
ncbi:hypothetical protein OV320_2646 [Actinobacteria bacterium OV320]|nr:hypothetical protein OV320_2646 [Actinobacteria bacterium OV320]